MSILDLQTGIAAAVKRDSGGAQLPWQEGSLTQTFCFAPPCGGAGNQDELEKLRQEKLALQAELEAARRMQREPREQRDGISTPSGKEITVSGRTYVAYDNGTALDTETNLLWMRCVVGQTWNGSTCSGEGKRFNDWEDAKKQTANFAGYSNWRLPTIEELRTLRYCSSGQPEYFGASISSCADDNGNGDYERPTIVQAVFPNTPRSNVWSGSPIAGYSFPAWFMGFAGGFEGYLGDGNDHARLVRTGQ